MMGGWGKSMYAVDKTINKIIIIWNVKKAIKSSDLISLAVFTVPDIGLEIIMSHAVVNFKLQLSLASLFSK